MKSYFLIFFKRYSYIILIFFIIAGMFNAKIALTAVFCMIGPIFLALLGKGRFWCGNICPRGSFFDNILINFSGKNKVPNFFKSKFFRISVIVFMFYMFGNGIYKNWGNPMGIGLIFYRMVVITTFIGIILSFLYNNRTWCNFCPMGTIASMISLFKKNRKKLIVSSNCVYCKICKTACPMGIVPYKYKGNPIEHSDCIQCGKCIKSCPKNAIN
ncbi:4Fe-4S binding protein [Clostridium tepidum]|uniref:4Fe-4S binding protein n=1 Tax=Clostridium tepidum TaxID=1962263 RepID=A0A1S9IDZ7_9CLOT|nr:4Fe-4S binding protein [Clostridium tepidum]MCR1933748.1 4Fe-4S binding protein [Clostridium tepidum]MDU6876727.1 4Fe-4S binding protein [Clostridium botulinum]OOO68537.1 4Fe-4S binding protein [Clostridium tepidum]